MLLILEENNVNQSLEFMNAVKFEFGSTKDFS